MSLKVLEALDDSTELLIYKHIHQHGGLGGQLRRGQVRWRAPEASIMLYWGNAFFFLKKKYK